ncbi:hypothetical protein [Corticibacter populi]|uniref:hypothetical protein n=1 Tax=Corticibacter populi TaxID=1550736 RepID=UPI00102BFDCA|nr:hypothetical protein [Corticibacter populi]RZS32108.1 hypothetical protein EV687_2794 [Corticibacter populi]
MPIETDTPQAMRRLFIAIGIWLALIMLAVLFATPEQFSILFNEQGPIEGLSTPAWIILGAWCLDPWHPRVKPLLTCGVMALFGGMREADWQHSEITHSTMLKVSFYMNPLPPIWHKLLAAIFTLALLATVVVGLRQLLAYVRASGSVRAALQPAWARVFVTGFLLTAFSKFLDRLINGLVEWGGPHIDGLAGRFIGGYEEGIELLLPFVFAYALWLFRRQQLAAKR